MEAMEISNRLLIEDAHGNYVFVHRTVIDGKNHFMIQGLELDEDDAMALATFILKS